MLYSLIVISIALLAVCTIGLFFWIAVLYRITRALRRQPTVRAGLELDDPPGETPKLSIVIPAHNEERVIDECARTLRGQTWPNLEIIFVLDRCTDRTLELVRAHAEDDDRIVIIENDACPEDWAGKCNAARIGAAAATGEWILFTDADTIFDPRLARSSINLAIDRDVHLITLYSTLTCDHYHERVAQPVACFSLIQIYPMERADRNRPPRAFANGQFMLFRRDWYDRLGGHEAVRDDLLEDLAFARKLRKGGGRSEVLLAENMLRVSMYDTLEGFKVGWRRIFIDACKRRTRRLRKHGRRVIAAGVVLPSARLAALPVAWGLLQFGVNSLAWTMLAVVLAGWLVQYVSLIVIYPLSGAPRWTVCFYPLGCCIVSRILFGAARRLEDREPIKWGGREYVPEPR